MTARRGHEQNAADIKDLAEPRCSRQSLVLRTL
jgi:hypothetical protein